MRKGRRVGLKGVYVPNKYEIYLDETDYEKLKPLLNHLASEMKEYVTSKAAEKKYILTGPVIINFEKDTEKKDYNEDEPIRIVTRYDQLPPGEGENIDSLSEDTLRYIPIRGDCAGKRINTLRRVVLELHNGEQVELEGDITSIGRRGTCDVCLTDNSVSRKHAVIFRKGPSYFISDQASTNGTFVNGSRVTSAELKPGDVIRMGNTILTFKVV